MLLVMMAHHAAYNRCIKIAGRNARRGRRASTRGGKCTGKGRFQSKHLTKDQETRVKVAEAAAREQASQDAAASTHQQSAADLTTLRVEVERLEKETDKLTKRAESLETQFESESQRSRWKEERAKELRAAAVESDIAHAAQLAKVCNQRESLGRLVRKFKAKCSTGGLSAPRCRVKAKAAKARMERRSHGGLRPQSKRITVPPISNGAYYRGFKATK
jgi:chromosome segregation ATPase